MSSYTNRPQKGNNLIAFPNEYTVIDLETTGFSPIADEIIELGAIKIRNGEIIDTFQSLCKPQNELDEYIERLTGITNEMLQDSPDITELIADYLNFIGDDIIVGHNVNFDINFVYDVALKHLCKSLRNDFVDTMRISRRLLPELECHSLAMLVEHYNIPYNNAHRSISDCILTFMCYEKIKEEIETTYGTVVYFTQQTSHKRPSKYINLKNITTEKTEFDCSHPFYGKFFVFTGALQNHTRTEVAKIVSDFGGVCENTITKRTNFLVLGNYENCKSIKEGKSSKHKKAEQLKLKGQDIDIIPESVFYDMIEV